MSSLEPEKLVVIGASTGGPNHIQKILHALPEGFPAAVVVAQHMDAGYVPSFVRLLGSRCALAVCEIPAATRLHSASVYVCPCSCVLETEGKSILINPVKHREKGYNPNINLLFESASAVVRNAAVLGVILTGIGDDGAKGCFQLSQAGGTCIAESEESAVVYGMPKRAYELNTAMQVKHLDEIIETILAFGA